MIGFKWLWYVTKVIRLHAAAALAVFCFNSQKNVDQIQEAIGMLTKSAMDELIDSKHPAYRYDAAFGELRILLTIRIFKNGFQIK